MFEREWRNIPFLHLQHNDLNFGWEEAQYGKWGVGTKKGYVNWTHLKIVQHVLFWLHVLYYILLCYLLHHSHIATHYFSNLWPPFDFLWELCYVHENGSRHDFLSPKVLSFTMTYLIPEDIIARQIAAIVLRLLICALCMHAWIEPDLSHYLPLWRTVFQDRGWLMLK